MDTSVDHPAGSGPQEETASKTQPLDVIKLDNDTTVTLDQGPEGSIVVVGTGPRGQDPEVSDLPAKAESIEQLYDLLKRPMPLQVRQALDRFDRAAKM